MKDVSIEDRLFYFERNFVSLDGLWMLETETHTDFETALKIDLIVWQKLLKIIIRRIKKYLNIETNTVQDIVEILSFRWSCEGWEYDIIKNEENMAIFHVIKCPYKAMMDRNEERHKIIPQICKRMCNPLYKSAIKSFNPKFEVDRIKFMGLGDKFCDFSIKLT